MPRLVIAQPKYRRHRASGQAVVTLNGRVFYLGRYGTTASRAEYDRLIYEWLGRGRQLPSVVNAEPESITVMILCARYLQFASSYYRKNGKPTGVLPALKCAIKYLRLWYGEMAAIEFGPLKLKALRQKMIDDGLSRTYINDHAARIKRIWKWAASEELVPPTAYQALAAVVGLARGRSGARETPPILPVDDAIVDATLPFMPDVPADMVRLQRLTGMRPEEVCIIRPCDIDRSGDVWLYRPSAHKTEHHGRGRTVFFGRDAQGVLLKYIARDETAFCFRPVDSEAKRLATLHEARKTPLSCGNRPGTNRVRQPKRLPGERYTTDGYRRAISRACDRAFPHPSLAEFPATALTANQSAEIDAWQKAHRWAPNRLRHSFATRVRKEFGLEAAQVALGHSSAAVSQIYAERDMAKGVEVARQIG